MMCVLVIDVEILKRISFRFHYCYKLKTQKKEKVAICYLVLLKLSYEILECNLCWFYHQKEDLLIYLGSAISMWVSVEILKPS